MKAPTSIFIDTNIFDENCYNFSSSVFIAFNNAVKGFDLKLLMPDPIKREILRHISENCDAAVKALKSALKEAPFLNSYSKFPKRYENHLIKKEIYDLKKDELFSFFKDLNTLDLSYDNVNISEIMDWSDQRIAPFTIQKSNEFSDSLAILILHEYFKRSFEDIAVISRDKGIEKACERYPVFKYYNSLQAYCEQLINSPARISEIHESILLYKDNIESSITEIFINSEFYLPMDINGVVSSPCVSSFAYLNFNIISLESNSCSVLFDGLVEYSVNTSVFEYETTACYIDNNYPMHCVNGLINESSFITGLINLELFNNKINAITSTNIDQNVYIINKRFPDIVI